MNLENEWNERARGMEGKIQTDVQKSSPGSVPANVCTSAKYKSRSIYREEEMLSYFCCRAFHNGVKPEP